MPPSDLATQLIDLFFAHVSDMFPILHRPTFVYHWNDGLQTHDLWFATVSLALFGVASRWSKDQRVLPARVYADSSDGTDDAWASAGLDYIDAVLGKLPAGINVTVMGPNFYLLRGTPTSSWCSSACESARNTGLGCMYFK